MQTIEEPAQIAHLVRGQGLLNLGQTGIREVGKGQVLRGAHGCDADQKRKDLGHREACGCLHRLRIKLHAATAPAFGMDHKAFVPQGGNITQDGAAGRTHLPGQFVNGRGAIAPQRAHDGIMSVSDIHFFTISHLVTKFGTIKR